MKHLLIASLMTFGLAPQLQAASLDVFIEFDDYPKDISWSVVDAGSAVVASGNGYTQITFVKETISLAAGKYVFNIMDSYGDGLCCDEGQGGYSLSLDNVQFYKSNGQFGKGETVAFAVPDPAAVVPLPAGMVLMLTAFGGLGLLRRRSYLA